MARVIWDNAALDEIDEASAYIRQFDSVAAERIGQSLFALGESLSQFPQRGRTNERGLRELTSVPPYILVYRIDGDDVHIVEVRHGRRRPPA